MRGVKLDAIVSSSELFVAIGTGALAFVTWLLVRETQRLARDWRQTSVDQIKAWEKSTLDQIGVQMWLALEARFDSKEMKRFRSELAFQLQDYKSSKHSEIDEHVLELFESIGTVYNRGLMNKELAASSFSYYAVYWWAAAESHIRQDRRKNKGDDSLFCEFEKFAHAMQQDYPKIDEPGLTAFLADELKVEDRVEAAAFLPFFQWSEVPANPTIRTINFVNHGATITDVSVEPRGECRVAVTPQTILPAGETGLLNIFEISRPVHYPIEFAVRFTTGREQRLTKTFVLDTRPHLPIEKRPE
jgi:hypothetical protein